LCFVDRDAECAAKKALNARKRDTTVPAPAAQQVPSCISKSLHLQNGRAGAGGSHELTSRTSCAISGTGNGVTLTAEQRDLSGTLSQSTYGEAPQPMSTVVDHISSNSSSTFQRATTYSGTSSHMQKFENHSKNYSASLGAGAASSNLQQQQTGKYGGSCPRGGRGSFGKRNSCKTHNNAKGNGCSSTNH
ncbi:unnamed protein product, partial [Amoebophrya sp. A25]